MNILIVKAHPSPHGHVHKIAETYAEAKKAKKNEVKIIDLYDPKNKEDFLCFDNIRDMQSPPEQIQFEKDVTWADEIVVVFPIWWGMPPAVMMNWVDLTFWAHFAYKFSPTGKMLPMLNGKTAKVFATAGGPSFIYYLPIFPLRQFWGLTLFRSVGIELVDFKVCGHLDQYKDEKKERHFQKFLRDVRESA